jgi:hypothetical protein
MTVGRMEILEPRMMEGRMGRMGNKVGRMVGRMGGRMVMLRTKVGRMEVLQMTVGRTEVLQMMVGRMVRLVALHTHQIVRSRPIHTVHIDLKLTNLYQRMDRLV